MRPQSLAEATLYLTLCFALLSLGATAPSSEFVVLAGIALATGLMLLSLMLHPERRVVWTWAWLPVVLFLALATLQIWPLPVGVIDHISPQTLALRAEALAGLPEAEAATQTTLSVYPLAGERQLRLLLAVSAVFIVVPQIIREPGQVRRLLGVIAGLGFAAAAMALWQRLSGDPRIPTLQGVVEPGHQNSGFFLNHSHFGQFVNLGLGAGLGLCAAILASHTAKRRQSRRAIDLDTKTHVKHLIDTVWKSSRLRTVRVILVMMAICAVAIPLSLTRGGTIAMAIAAVIAVVLFFWHSRRESRRHLDTDAVGGLASIALAGGMVILAVVMAFALDIAVNRMTTLNDFDNAQGGRQEILRDVSTAIEQFPVVGLGLGTFREAFPYFQSSDVGGASEATHAENEYAQLLFETGFVGGAIALGFAVIVGWNLLRCIRTPRPSVRIAAVGICFSLVAILVGSLGDFGQHVPGIALVTATLCGLAIALPHVADPQATANQPIEPARSKASVRWALVPRLAALAGVAFATTWALQSARADVQAETALTKAGAVLGPIWEETDENYEIALRGAGAAVQAQPRDVRWRYDLNRLRWQAILHESLRADATPQVREQLGEFAQRISTELHAARSLAPTFGPTAAVAGQIDYFALGQLSGADAILAGFRFAPNRPEAAFAAAQLSLDRNDPNAALEALRRAVAHGGSRLEATMLLVDAGAYTAAAELASGDRDAMLRLAKAAEEGPDAPPEFAATLRADADSLLREQASDERPDLLMTLGREERKAGNLDVALDLFHRAVARNSSATGWRLELSSLMEEMGDFEGALREARFVLNLKPDHAEARKRSDMLAMKVATLQDVAEQARREAEAPTAVD